MARIAVGGLLHETNTFAPQPATLDLFLQADAWPELLRGPGMLERVRGSNIALAGFAAAAGAAGHELLPLVWANAGPSGRVAEAAFERIVGWLIEDLSALLPVDAAYLDLHGAMATTHLDDGEGEILRRVRRLIGPRTPLVASLDLHANVSEDMVAASDALVAYRTYPHVDMAETGGRAAKALESLLAGRRLAKAHRKGGFLVCLPAQCSTVEPARSIYAMARDLEAGLEGPVSLVMGFPVADVHCGGPSFLAYAAEAAAAEAAVAALARAFAEAESGFHWRFWSPEEAVLRIRNLGQDERLILADSQDNPGGGGTGDTTGLLAALVEARVRDAVLGLLHDPEAAAAAHRAGRGGILGALLLGGRHGPEGVSPLRGDFEVVALSDGRFQATGPFYGGNRMDLGPMAVLRPQAAPGLEIVVASRRIQAADRAMFAHLGIDLGRRRVIALKSSVHFRADFERLADKILMVKAPGYVAADPGDLSFERLPATIRTRGQWPC